MMAPFSVIGGAAAGYAVATIFNLGTVAGTACVFGGAVLGPVIYVTQFYIRAQHRNQ